MSDNKAEGGKVDLNAKFKETDPIKIILAIFFPRKLLAGVWKGVMKL